MCNRYPYRHHGPPVYGSKLLDYLITEMNMREDGLLACYDYQPDLMAGGTDCAKCGWPREHHDIKED